VGILESWKLGPSEVLALVGAGGKTTLLRAVASAYEREGAVPLLTTTTQVWAPEPGERACVTAGSPGDLVRRVREELAREGEGKDRGSSQGATGEGSSSPEGLSSGQASSSRGAPGRGFWVGRSVSADGKLQGIPPEWTRRLRDIPGVEAVLVEADGAAGRSLKAPAPWEPVLPAAVTTVVAVAGLDAQGASLDGDKIHRREEVERVLGPDSGEGRGKNSARPCGRRVAPCEIPAVLLRGYQKHTPPSARLLLFLNKEDEHPVDPGLEQAASGTPVEVWCGSARALAGGEAGGESIHPGGRHDREQGAALRVLRKLEPAPVAVIAAAGMATRMGGEKVLASLGAGTVLGRVVRTALSCSWLERIVVVAGDGAEAMEEALRTELSGRGSGKRFEFRDRLHVVINSRPEQGLASSLRVGVTSAGSPGPILVLLGDQPLVRVETLDAIWAAARGRPRAAVVGLAEEREEADAEGLKEESQGWAGRGGRGVRPPVLLHRSLTPQLLELEGDQGARGILQRYSGRVAGVVRGEEEALDVDTPAQLDFVRAFVEEDGRAGV